ncbi:NAD(P)/FAD-dependent oxidoreductase [Acuticoccus mangrovi]|uniref:FAD-binding oxidoreductase n=1 Tax=Acuticoccus mangrovi TaxID=2796142 RepID=A0A934MK17_9HYPH|nr:FAD-binding oxidoreductase [Acuticoccus mangrovi]MBJ3775079.1 FAD-binding oxidoreductase [Acuticoccus mangrovi]
MERFDVIVLGAGMVGIGTAVHLRDRGRHVALVDRRGPAEETSFGNAGLIQSEAIMPYAFPRDPKVILGVITGQRTDARVVWHALPATARWLLAYVGQSGPAAVHRTAIANVPILARALPEHMRLMERAGATDLLRSGGYIRVYREAREIEAALEVDEAVRREFGVPYEAWDGARLREEEPHIASTLAGAVHMPEPGRVIDPSDTGKAYAALFEREGGTFRIGEAASLARDGSLWRVETEAGPIAAPDVVVALGPWSGDALAREGVRVPLGVKRGYHRHYRPARQGVLNHLVLDPAVGYALGTNKRGFRLTTGAEFDRRDAPPTPVQLARVEQRAREIFPLGEAIDEPWLGSRPCLPDLLPMIGPVPGKAGLWAHFGHHHLGFTLGPATGRLLAEMMTGETPYADPTPYRVDRFAA